MTFSPGNDFTVRGQLDGRPVDLRYTDGTLEGNDEAVSRVRQVLAQRDDLRLTPQDEERPATLADPYAVMAAIQEVLDIDEVEGNYPIPEADDSAT